MILIGGWVTGKLSKKSSHARMPAVNLIVKARPKTRTGTTPFLPFVKTNKYEKHFFNSIVK
jgi:hypothetical protein